VVRAVVELAGRCQPLLRPSRGIGLPRRRFLRLRGTRSARYCAWAGHPLIISRGASHLA
jgi:hypothetical protein